jgi:diacylglycerol kinase family enzyme
MRALLIHTPSAGTSEPSSEALMESLRRAGLTPTYCSTTDARFPEVLREPTDLVVAAGGDGTVARVIKQMPDPKVPIAILPLGTANNIARSLGIEGAPEELAPRWKQARRRALDLGVASGPWRRRFVEAIGIGLLAEAMREIDAADVPGPHSVWLSREAFRKKLGKAPPLALQVVVDQRPLPEQLLLVEVMSMCRIGPGINLAPGVEFSDGVLDVVYVEPSQRADLLAWLDTPGEAGPPPVSALKGRDISLYWEGTPLHLDDAFPAPPDRPSTITIGLERAAVTVLVP